MDLLKIKDVGLLALKKRTKTREMLSSLCHKKIWKLTNIWLQTLHSLYSLLWFVAHYIAIAVIYLSIFRLFCFCWQSELAISLLFSFFFKPKATLHLFFIFNKCFSSSNTCKLCYIIKTLFSLFCYCKYFLIYSGGNPGNQNYSSVNPNYFLKRFH